METSSLSVPEQGAADPRAGFGLEGKRIACTASRRAEELVRLIERAGGTALLCPTMTTHPLGQEEGAELVRCLLRWRPDWLVLTTGAGVEALLAHARRAGLGDRLLGLLRQCRLAVRGYKTLRALADLGIEPEVRDRHGTMADLLAALAAFPWGGRRVAVQAYGEPLLSSLAWLTEQGAEVREFALYRHGPAPAPYLDRLLAEVRDGQVDAVAFTSAFQVRFLFDRARQKGPAEVAALQVAFARRVVAVAVGAVTVRALREEGVERVVCPETERIGTMVRALLHHFAAGDDRGG